MKGLIDLNMKKVFLAGIIQGSGRDKSIHPQDYRERIETIFNAILPETEIYNPFDGHENSVHYDIEKGKSVFNSSMAQIKKCDLMIAYLPAASLGTAVEMWECYKLGIPVWTITAMKDNWIVRFCSEKIFENIESLENHLRESYVSISEES